MGYKAFSLLISVIVPFVIILFIVRRYREPIKKSFFANTKSRFLSIVLGIVASAVILFVFHVVIKFLELLGLKMEFLKDETYSYLIKTIFSLVVTAIFIVIARWHLEEYAKIALDQMNTRYQELSGHAIAYFNSIFQFRDSMEENNILREVLSNHKELGEKKKFLVTFNTYLEIVMSFLKQGYSLTSVNNTLIPFWYSPKTQDESTLKYINYFKDHEKEIKYKRITYYQDDNWRENTVGMIYEDLYNSPGGEEYAITWFVTLLSFIDFDYGPLFSIIDFVIEDNINYHKQPESDETIKGIRRVISDPAKLALFDTYVEDNSRDITLSAIEKFKATMGPEGCLYCSKKQFTNMFNFDKSISEIGLFEKGSSCFSLNLIGNVSDTVTLQLVTESEQLARIQTSILELSKINDAKK